MSELNRKEIVLALASGGHLAGVDLSGADLKGLNLAHADLTGTNMQGADLRGCTIGHKVDMANLAGADLRDTKLDDGFPLGSTVKGVLVLSKCKLDAAIYGGEAHRAEVSARVKEMDGPKLMNAETIATIGEMKASGETPLEIEKFIHRRQRELQREREKRMHDIDAEADRRIAAAATEREAKEKELTDLERSRPFAAGW